MDEYVGKIEFANAVGARGAKFLKYASDKLNAEIISNDTDDLYILYFSEATRKDPTWSRNQQVLLDLLDNPPPNSRVLVVDFDRDIYIEHRRGGKVIVDDVADLEELEDKSLVKCDDHRLVKSGPSLPRQHGKTADTFPHRHGEIKG